MGCVDSKKACPVELQKKLALEQLSRFVNTKHGCSVSFFWNEEDPLVTHSLRLFVDRHHKQSILLFQSIRIDYSGRSWHHPNYFVELEVDRFSLSEFAHLLWTEMPLTQRVDPCVRASNHDYVLENRLLLTPGLQATFSHLPLVALFRKHLAQLVQDTLSLWLPKILIPLVLDFLPGTS